MLCSTIWYQFQFFETMNIEKLLKLANFKPVGSSQLSSRFLTSTAQIRNISRDTSHEMAANLGSKNIVNNEKEKKLYLKFDDGKEAFVNYEIERPNTLNLYHCEIPIELRGNGLGKVLANKSFEYVKDNSLKMKLTCTYLRHYYKTCGSKFKDYVDE